ncbi:MAG: LacI family DNA-binding transcriptional regulator [Eubacteriales bacterium]|nr:LacI family DNA-binding transcriptional regulator [Eubacteriales bacterium]
MDNKEISGTATLKNVAKLAGVSIATASRVLNNTNYPVKPELKKKVLDSARKLNYIPPSTVKPITSNQSKTIAVIVPTLQNPFFNQVILGIESAASQQGYKLMIFSSHRSVEQERNHINSLLSNRVSALIIISIDSNGDALQKYVACGGRVALLEANFKFKNAILCETDHFFAGQTAVEYLVERGHRNIAFLTAPLTKSYRRNILIGVTETMKDYGLPFSDDDIFVEPLESESDTGIYEFELGKKLGQSFLQSSKKHSAIIAINDMTAFGIIQSLSQNGVSIPNQVSVISFDNILFSEMTSPPLTTVELPSTSMGTTICNMLINSLSGEKQELYDVVLRFQVELVERGSVTDYCNT